MLVLLVCFLQEITQEINAFKGPALYQITEPVDHAECPVWNKEDNFLYYVDIHDGRILGYDYEEDKVVKSLIITDNTVSPALRTTKKNQFLIGANNSIILAEFESGKNVTVQKKPEVLMTIEDKPTSRFNEGKADKKGRVWIGSMGNEDRQGNLNPNQGALYMLTKDNYKNPKVLISPVNISNGLAWNKADDKFYYIDSPSMKVVVYDYDNEKGEISNKRTVFDVTANGVDCHPDGMDIDKDDQLWIALYGCGSVLHINPENGALLQQIPIPATYVTSVIWGGPEMDVLFVTTSRYPLSQEERMKQPGAGSVFAIKGLGTHGFPMNEADIEHK